MPVEGGGAGACVDLWATATPEPEPEPDGGGGAWMTVDVVFDERVVAPELADALLQAVSVVLAKMHADDATSIATLREAASWGCFECATKWSR